MDVREIYGSILILTGFLFDYFYIKFDYTFMMITSIISTLIGIALLSFIKF